MTDSTSKSHQNPFRKKACALPDWTKAQLALYGGGTSTVLAVFRWKDSIVG